MSAYNPTGHEAIHSLIEDFASIARHIHVSENLEWSLARITATAETAIGGCEAASISLLTAEGPVTRAPTHQLAIAGDNIQYEENEGPCMDASMREPWISTPNLGCDPRWPRSAARLSKELGVRSMFSSRLTLDAAPNQTLGGLNLYATVPEAFSTQDQMLAVLLTSLAAVVVDGSRQQEQLRAAIESRQVIGEAIGIVRAELKLDSSQAFALLVKASQRTNVKLRDLARQIADGPSSSQPV